MKEEFEIALVKLVDKLLKRTQKDMFKKLNDKRIRKITGKLHNSINNITIKQNGSGFSIKYVGPYYASYVDKRVPAYIGFKGFKKLPTHYQDPLRAFIVLLMKEVKKPLTDQFRSLLNELKSNK